MLHSASHTSGNDPHFKSGLTILASGTTTRAGRQARDPLSVTTLTLVAQTTFCGFGISWLLLKGGHGTMAIMYNPHLAFAAA